MREDDVDTPSQRLQEARAEAGFATASEAARAFGWNENTYRSHENGERGLKKSIAEKYAKAFKVSISKILLGEDSVKFISRSVIVGTIGNGGVVKTSEKDEGRYIADLAMMFSDIIYAFEVEEDSSLIVFQPGDLLLVWDLNTKNRLAYGSYCIVDISISDLVLRLVQEGSKPGYVHLEFPMNPTKIDIKPRSISIVHAIVPRSQWTKVDTISKEEIYNPRWPIE